MDIRLLGTPDEVRDGLAFLRQHAKVKRWSDERPSDRHHGQVLVYVTATIPIEVPVTGDGAA
jgi:hypothetical protein